jgi:acyl carrier protein
MDIQQRLTSVFRDVFNDDTLSLRPDLTASEVENWDSLNHIDMITAVEREFKIRFTTGDVSSMKNVGDLMALIQKKTSSRP